MDFTSLLDFAYLIIDKLESFAYTLIEWFQEPIQALNGINLIDLLFGVGVGLILTFLLAKILINIVG